MPSERRVRVVLRERDAELVKQRWLTVESFTALLIEACGRNIIDNDMLISLAFD
jgi:hypothetical protein